MLPDAWTYRRVADHPHPVDQTVQTGPFGAQLHADDYVDEGVPFILIRNIKNSRIDPSGIPKISFADATRLDNYALQEGDIVFSRVGRVGSCFLAEVDHVGWIISGQLLRMRLDMADLDPKFLIHWIASPYVERHILGESVGTTRQSINSSILASMPIPAIPKAEQSKIARILDTLDTTIRQTEAIIEKLKQVKQGLLHDLLTRGIDTNGELRPSQSQAPHLYKDSPLGWIPEGWQCATLDDLVAAPICYGIVQVFAFVPDGVPVLAIKDLLGDYVTGIHRTARSIDAAYSRSRVQAGDVLTSIKGTIGRIGVVPDHYEGNISRDMARLRPGPMIRSGYFCQLLQSPIGQQILGLAQVGTTRAELSIAPLRKLRFAIPEPREQALIEEALNVHDKRVRTEKAALSKLRAEKFGLMDDLLTGRVRVTPLLA